MNRKALGSILITLLLCLFLSGCSALSQKNSTAVNTSNPDLKAEKTTVKAQRESASNNKKAAEQDYRTVEAKGKAGYNKPNPPTETRANDSVKPVKALPGAEKSQDIVNASTETPDALTNQRVRLVVTRDFGQSLISDRWVMLDQPTTALSITTANLEVKTAYGGTFVNSINGISSGYTGKAAWDKVKRDWFFYCNGKISSAGAANTQVKAGDIIWWDYHDWSGKQKDLPPVPPGAGS